MGIYRIFFWIYIIFFLFSSPAFAHKVIIFAWVEGDTVFTQSKFSGGKKVMGGEIIVKDMNDKTLLKGKTNADGEFSFKIPQKTSLKIELIAGMGHRNEWIIQANEITGVVEKSPPPKAKTKTSTVLSLKKDEFQAALEKSLDKKLRPIIKMLAQERQVSATEIFGGIGYIFGLMGITLYFKSQQK